MREQKFRRAKRWMAEELLIVWFRSQFEPFPNLIFWWVAEKALDMACWVTFTWEDWAYHEELCQDLARQMEKVFNEANSRTGTDGRYR